MINTHEYLQDKWTKEPFTRTEHIRGKTGGRQFTFGPGESEVLESSSLTGTTSVWEPELIREITEKDGPKLNPEEHLEPD